MTSARAMAKCTFTVLPDQATRSMPTNKVHHVTTINRVAEQFGEDEDWLHGVANEMEIEDGVIWVYGVGEDGVLAFTDFGIENLIELVKMYKENPASLKRWDRHD
jgi:hypothetical protein